MARADKKNAEQPNSSKTVSSLIPQSSKRVIAEEVLTETAPTEAAAEVEKSDEPKTLPKIRLRVEEEAVKVKQFASAQGLSMHLKVVKAKRAGLGALHKVATWLTPKKKK